MAELDADDAANRLLAAHTGSQTILYTWDGRGVGGTSAPCLVPGRCSGESPRYAVAVLLEHPPDPQEAAQMGVLLLHAVR